MKKILLSLSVALLATVLVVGGCKKNSTDPGTGDAPKPPSISFSVPGLGDACGQQAYGLVQAVNYYSTQFTIFGSLPPTNNGNEYSWAATVDSLTISIKSTRQSDGSFTWEIKFNGTQDGETFNNQVVAEGSTAANGLSGNFTFYDETHTAVGTFQFTATSPTAGTGTLIEMSGGVQAAKVVVTSNANGSGEVTYFVNNGGTFAQAFHATWASSGGTATCN